MIIPLYVILLTRFCDALIGYDCETPYENGTTVSLLEDDACQINEGNLLFHDVYIEALQHPRVTTVDVLTCRIEIEYNINDSINSKVDYKNIIKNKRYYAPLNASSCAYIHAYRRFQFKNSSFDNLSINDVNSRLISSNVYNKDDIQSLGNLKSKEKVNVFIHIVFKSYSIKVDLITNKILLPTGTTCKYTHLECTDEEGYQNFWSPAFLNGCEKLTHSVIYRGTAKRMQSMGHLGAYALTHSNTRIILFIHKQHSVCNATVLQTELPRILIREISEEYLKNQKYINKMRFLAYSTINSYIHVINNNNLHIKDVYISLSLEKCIKREKELHTSIIMAHRDPSLLAHTIIGMPGYSAYIRGEAAQFYKCTPVPARLRNTEDCFLELPVTIDDKPMYLQPKTRTITARGTEITCNPLATALYRIKNQWHVLAPKPEEFKHVPEALHMKAMPWGSKPDIFITADTSTDEESIITEDRQHDKDTTYMIHISATPIIIWTVVLATIITIIRRYKKKCYLSAQQQFCDHSKDCASSKCRFSEHPDEATAESTCNNHKDNAKPVHPMYQSHEVSEMTDEIYNLKTAYQRLEMRLNKCIYPMQAGLNKLAVAPSRRCSQLNEGGVTTGDYV